MNVPILAEEYLSRLVELKQEMEECQHEIRLIYAKLSKYLAEGHLDYLKSSSGSITYKDKQYIPVKGRVIYDYSSDPDIIAKQKELRQLKKLSGKTFSFILAEALHIYLKNNFESEVKRYLEIGYLLNTKRGTTE
jgi:uncharacterized protein (UPF0297 family)